MNKIRKYLSLTLLFTGTFAFAAALAWKIDKGYEIIFDSNAASGNFEKFTGTIQFDPNDLKSSKFNVTIDVNSISTSMGGLQNRHAKGEDWFDGKKFPNITFKSAMISKSKDGYLVTGSLQIKNVKKTVTIPFNFTQTGNSGIFTGKFSVNRTDYGVGTPGGLVDETIKLSLKVPVNK